MGQSIQLLTPFHFGWYSFGLPGYRPCHSTYELYPYDNLPPIPEDQLIGKLQWLAPLDREIDAQMQTYRFPTELRAEWHPLWIEGMKEIVALSQSLGLSLPDAFLQFSLSTELQDRIPSATDCWFLFSSIVPCPGCNDGHIIRFLYDNQGCLSWYLYLAPNGQTCVLVSDTSLVSPSALGNISGEEVIAHAYVCAPSFEAFLYRFWLENVLFFNLIMRKPLTKEQMHYLSYYKQRRG